MLSNILRENSISLNLLAESKDDLIIKMLELANNSGAIIDFNKTKSEVFAREKIMSTGIGNSIALPHAKTNGVKEAIAAFARMEVPIEFDSLDGMPVKYVFLLLGREDNVGVHIRLLSKISRLMNNDNFIDKINNSKENSEVTNLIKEFEI